MLQCWHVFSLLFSTHIVCLRNPYKALCIVISFLVLRFICWNSSLVYFKNDPEYFKRGTAQMFILLMRFLLCSLVSPIIGTTIIPLIPQPFQFSGKVKVFLYRFALFHFHSVINSNGKIYKIYKRKSICISKSQRILCVPFTWTDSCLCV